MHENRKLNHKIGKMDYYLDSLLGPMTAKVFRAPRQNRSIKSTRKGQQYERQI
jgi:hypothetical protein